MSVVRVTLTQLLYAQVIQNVLHFNFPDMVSSDGPTLLTNVRDHWWDIHRQWCDDHLVLISISGENLDTHEQWALPTNLPGSGSSVSNSPLQLSLVIKLGTGIGGRRNRGRIYIAGVAPNQMNSGLFNSSHLTQAVDFCATLLDRWCVTPSYGATLGIHGPNDSAGDIRLVTSMSPRATVGTQRRRGVGIGI